MTLMVSPDVESLLIEFLEREREELQKARYEQLATSMARLADAFTEHKEADRRWKADVRETLSSHESRMNRHARRIADRELDSDRPPKRNPEDTLNNVDVRELNELRGWAKWRKEKLANILITIALMTLSAGAVAMIQEIARAH